MAAKKNSRPNVPVNCLGCGKPFMAVYSAMLRGKGKYCGRACSDLARRTHGATVGDRPSAEYKIWVGIKVRCYNKAAKAFPDYGGRGIVMSDEWRDDYAAFLAAVGPRPSPQHTIDRIDNDRGYEPGNVRWATRTDQSRNARSNRFLTVNGVTRCCGEWAALAGITRPTLAYRLHKGWPVERAVSEPSRARRPNSPKPEPVRADRRGS
jgi:hypothetical protein